MQVAKALINEADALEHLGDREATLATCHDLLTRFPNPRTDQMKELRSTAQDIMNDYDHVLSTAPGAATVFAGAGAGRAARGPAGP